MAASGNNAQQRSSPTARPAGVPDAPDAIATDHWVGIDEAAAYLAIPVRTLYRLAQRGAVPAAKVGRTWRFRRSLLDAHMAAHGAGLAPADPVAGPIAPAPASTAQPSTAPPRPSTGVPPPTAAAGPHRRPDPTAAEEHPRDEDAVRFLAALGDFAATLVGRGDPSGIARDVAARLSELLDVDMAGIGERAGDSLVVQMGSRSGQEHRPLTIPAVMTGTARPVLERGESLIFDSSRRLPLAARPVFRMLGIRSALVVPIFDGSTVWGLLGAASRGARRFDDADRERLEAVAGQVGMAISNARLLAESRRWSEHLEGIEALGRELNRSRSLREVGEAVAREIEAVIEWDGLRFYVLQPDGVTLEAITLKAKVPYYAQETPDMVRLRLGEGLGGILAASRVAENVGDVLHDPRMQDIPGTEDVDESMIVVPLVFEDEVLGVLELSRLGLDRFAASDLRLLQIIGAQAAVALANARQVEELERRARTDGLTGLPNRALFIERVEQALARRARIGGRIAVLFLDLDGFKVVNDSLGHQAGDLVLAAVGERLRRSLRAADTIARLGGDEFGVLIEDVRDAAEPVRAAERVAEALRAPFRLDSRLVPVRASVGVVLDDGEAGSADELLRNADVAMYRAKAHGRGTFAVFEPSMHAAQLARLEMESELRVAIERGEFALRFQPIVSLADGRLTALEALLRWHHPQRGVISPLDFVPLAEETGQIVPIGAWVLHEATRQLARWRREGVVPGQAAVSVNLSTRQLLDGAFLGEVDSALAATGLEPSRLVLEVTESIMLGDDSTSVGVLHALRRHGVHIALDDFGTGYSSLGYLRSLPADAIKVDRTFIDGLGTEREKTAIVEAAIAFAHALDLSVTAEGIETDAQLGHLKALGCDHGQGFRISAPLPATDLEALLRSGAPLIADQGATSAA